jgi:hypothetical protein
MEGRTNIKYRRVWSRKRKKKKKKEEKEGK